MVTLYVARFFFHKLRMRFFRFFLTVMRLVDGNDYGKSNVWRSRGKWCDVGVG